MLSYRGCPSTIPDDHWSLVVLVASVLELVKPDFTYNRGCPSLFPLMELMATLDFPSYLVATFEFPSYIR